FTSPTPAIRQIAQNAANCDIRATVLVGSPQSCGQCYAIFPQQWLAGAFREAICLADSGASQSGCTGTMRRCSIADDCSRYSTSGERGKTAAWPANRVTT